MVDIAWKRHGCVPGTKTKLSQPKILATDSDFSAKSDIEIQLTKNLSNPEG
jgi:hypothetical protein